MNRIPECFRNCSNVSFAALNSSSGFVSYFDETFSHEKLNRLIVLKGGPGTGKSTLLKTAAKRLEEGGESVEYYLCSSDESSLDGVLFPERKIAIVDGTAPHTVEARYPMVFEEFFDTARFLNREKLSEKRENVFDLTREKRACYARAYHLLKMAGEVERQGHEQISTALNRGKMQAAAERFFFRRLKGAAHGEILHRQITAFGGSGKIHTDSFSTGATAIYTIGSFWGAGREFLSCLLSLAQKHGVCAGVSYDPLCPTLPESLFFAERNVLVCIGEETEGAEKINMLRFLSAEVLRRRRNHLRLLKQCSDALISESEAAFEDARAIHAQLEEIYVEAMDFEGLNEMWEETFAGFFR